MQFTNLKDVYFTCKFLGSVAAICVVFFWSGRIVISRLGVASHLTSAPSSEILLVLSIIGFHQEIATAVE